MKTLYLVAWRSSQLQALDISRLNLKVGLLNDFVSMRISNQKTSQVLNQKEN